MSNVKLERKAIIRHRRLLGGLIALDSLLEDNVFDEATDHQTKELLESVDRSQTLINLYLQKEEKKLYGQTGIPNIKIPKFVKFLSSLTKEAKKAPIIND